LSFSIILLCSSLITPFRIAFGEIVEPFNWRIFNNFCNFSFFIDIVITFNSAYYDDEFILIDDRKKIFVSYAKGWLVIDILAIIPFDDILMEFNY